jgi:hypothetical protein
MASPAALYAAAAVLRRQNDVGHHQVAEILEAIATGGLELRTVIGPGQRSAATRARLAERDRLVREGAARFYPGARPARTAKLMATAMQRFEAVAWRHWPGESAPEACPDRYAHDVRSVAWRILKAGAAIPGERTIRRILATS